MEAEPMALQGGWSSLPADLVNRVADCLLATNDLDCYTDLRAVCNHWRSVTVDPRSSQHDPRFRPRRWVMLDEHKIASSAINIDSAFLFVNTATGRFVRRSLPFPHGYHLVTTSTDGFLVVEDAGPPYDARIVNPFTGSSICFKARLPSEESMTADVVFASDRPTLVLAARTSSDEFTLYLADPDSKRFDSVKMYSTSSFLSALRQLLFNGPRTRSPLLHLPWLAAEVAPGEILVVDKRKTGIRFYRMNSAWMAIERVTSIGDYALFIGTGRCISVRADCFPSIKANCIYYKEVDGARSGSYWVYDVAHDREERIAPSAILPATLAQLFVDYTVCVRATLGICRNRGNGSF